MQKFHYWLISYYAHGTWGAVFASTSKKNLPINTVKEFISQCQEKDAVPISVSYLGHMSEIEAKYLEENNEALPAMPNWKA